MAEEKNFENRLKSYLRSKGAYVVKIWGGGFQVSGIPDLIVCYKGNFIAIEVKAEKGIVSELQKSHIRQIQKAEGYGFILRPSDFEKFKEIFEAI